MEDEELRAEISLCLDLTCSAAASFVGSHCHLYEENCHSFWGKEKEAASKRFGDGVCSDNQVHHWGTFVGGRANYTSRSHSHVGKQLKSLVYCAHCSGYKVEVADGVFEGLASESPSEMRIT